MHLGRHIFNVIKVYNKRENNINKQFIPNQWRLRLRIASNSSSNIDFRIPFELVCKHVK